MNCEYFFIYQHSKEVKMALVMTPSCLESYESGIDKMTNVSINVLPGIKHISKKAAEVAMQNDITFVHMKVSRDDGV